jgi:hypothetical protein
VKAPAATAAPTAAPTVTCAGVWSLTSTRAQAHKATSAFSDEVRDKWG